MRPILTPKRVGVGKGRDGFAATAKPSLGWCMLASYDAFTAGDLAHDEVPTLGVSISYLGYKLNHNKTAGFSPWFHLPGFHLGYLFLT